MRGHAWRHRVTLNPWALLRPLCWVFGHDRHEVLPGDVWARYHWVCVRCLREWYP